MRSVGHAAKKRWGRKMTVTRTNPDSAISSRSVCQWLCPVTCLPPSRQTAPTPLAQGEKAWIFGVTCLRSRIKKYFLLKYEGKNNPL